MASRSRSVSPVGASRFERPYTLPSRPTFTQYIPPPMAYQTKYHRRKQHQRDVSMSTWSDTSEASTPRDYSTAPSSAQQSPVDRLPALKKETVPWTHQHYHHSHNDHNHHDLENVHDPEPDDWHEHFEAYDQYGYDYGDECPDGANLASVNDILLHTASGTQIPFGSLYHPDTAINQRQLFIFVRHFYCGACQAYLKAITEGISLQDYFSIPIPTSIIVIGCGSPNLIPFYKAITGTQFPVFAEPSRQLYKKFGMVLSGKIGRERPEYMKDVSTTAWLGGQVKTMRQGLRARRSVRKVSRMIDGFDLVSNGASSRASSSISGRSTQLSVNHHDHDHDHGDDHDDHDNQVSVAGRQHLGQSYAHDHDPQLAAMALRKRDLVRGGNPFQIGGEFLFENGEVIWCHRMRHYRDHVEVADIRRLLELDD